MILKWRFQRYCIDPVCGKRINPVKSGIAAIHGGCSYYFCSPQCWSVFQAAPAQFAPAPLPAPKGWWQRYLQRVDKTTQGKPPCCH